MAANLVNTPANELKAVISGALSGTPQVMGQLPCVALEDADAANQLAVKLDGVFTLSVKGIDGGGNVAVANGDILYFVSGDTPKLSKKTSGVRFGYAWSPTAAAGATLVASGATTTIQVKLGY